MNETDNIDFLWVLEIHGWSTVILFIDGEITELAASHCFSNPLLDFTNTMISLVNGVEEETITWYSEPGGYHWKIKRKELEKHKLLVTIYDIVSEFGDEKFETEILLQFELKQTQFITLFYSQLNKINDLIKEASYSKNRIEDFPSEAYKKLKEIWT